MDNHSILIVEDELITAESIAELLEAEGYTLAGIAKDAATALRICSGPEGVPAVVICDINIKGNVNGTALASQLKELYHCEIIFLTAYADRINLQAAFCSNPVMYVVKPYSVTQLLVAVQMAFHKMYEKDKAAADSPFQLTARESEIICLIGRGLTTKQIAHQLGITAETVKTHRKRMLQKHNVGSIARLVYLAGGGS